MDVPLERQLSQHDNNIEVLKSLLKSHRRIKFSFCAKWVQLFCFNGFGCCCKNVKVYKQGLKKLDEEVNVINMLKTIRACQTLLKQYGDDRSLLLERNISN